MSGKLDPYHRWLGIPPEEQPPHHYRLLGLALFESELEVIRDAAERQMAHVRGYGLGKHATLSQKILNELAAAKACLSDPAKKADYDRRLRQELPAEGSAPQPAGAGASSRPAAIPPPTARPGAPPKLPDAPVAASEVSTRRPIHAPSDASVPRATWMVAGAVGGLLCIVAIGVVASLGRNGEESPSAEEPQAASAPAAGLPLKILPVGRQVVEEGKNLSLLVQVENPETAGGDLHYRLGPGAPQGANIEAKTGKFTWTPTEEQGPGVYPITVEVAGPGANRSSGQSTFQVHVREVNRAPRIQPVEHQTVGAQKASRFSVAATDPDKPPNQLTFSLIDAPDWIRIDGLSGTITCTPATAHAGTSYRLTVSVSDNALPMPLHHEQAIQVAVARPMGPQQQATLAGKQSLRAGLTPPPGSGFGPGLSAARPTVPFGTNPPPAPSAAGPARAIRRDGPIALPSGRELDPSLFRLSRQTVISQASSLLSEALQASVPGAVTSHRVAGLLHPNDSLFALFSQKTARRVMDRELDGVLITFYPSYRPVTSFLQQAPAPPRFAPGARPVPSPQVSIGPRPESDFWKDVSPRLYVNYEQGKKDGWLKSWDEQFRNVYWCEYIADRRSGLCCLFEDDELAMAVERQADDVRAVHWISDDGLLESFDSADQAKRDENAGPVWERLVEVETQLEEYERSFKETKREQEDTQVARGARRLGPKKRASISGRLRQRDALKNEFLGNQWKGAMGRSGAP